MFFACNLIFFCFSVISIVTFFTCNLIFCLLVFKIVTFFSWSYFPEEVRPCPTKYWKICSHLSQPYSQPFFVVFSLIFKQNNSPNKFYHKGMVTSKENLSVDIRPY